MELLMAIALMCDMDWIPTSQLHCQKYYINCVEKTKRGINTPLLEENEKELVALKVCVKTANISAMKEGN